MINKKLITPQSIAVIGGSNDTRKPGGKVLKNLIDSGYQGKLYVVNPKESQVQGVQSYPDPRELPQTDLAILAIAAKYCPATVRTLAEEKQTGGFIIFSAGFSEENEEGAKLEREVSEIVEKNGASLIGPNCIGLLNNHYAGVFTTPIPKLSPQGVDFISGSGATAVFIMEAGMPKGLMFNSVYSVGNSAQLGVEDVLEHLDETFDPEHSPKVKLLYIESINKPQKLLRHARSLIGKGCRIAAIKAGSSQAGARAASSHTGAMASSDVAVDALFTKAGIVRCHSRDELVSLASVFLHKPLEGKRIAIITHAGGPGVMLTDALSTGGMEVPKIEGPAADELLEELFPGSSVANPIDFLATGTAAQLGTIIEYCEKKFDHIDAMVVIFGSPGLFPVHDVYDVLDEKMKSCRKPIYPVLPSIINVKEEIESFLAKGRLNFPDEVALGRALVKVANCPQPEKAETGLPGVDEEKIRAIVDKATDGYLSPEENQQMLDAAGIRRAGEYVAKTRHEAVDVARKIGFPIVMKVFGPLHKSDKGGVMLNIRDTDTVRKRFDEIMQIEGAKAVILQPMLGGSELIAGVKYEEGFGHMVLAGLGGIFVEIMRDVSVALAPVSTEEAGHMIQGLRSYPLFKGIRGRAPINEQDFAGIIRRLSALVSVAPEIEEMDLNPLMASNNKITAVDSRIRIRKQA